jgi:hypothetical protein
MLEISNLTAPLSGTLEPVCTGMEVIKCLLELLLIRKDKGAIVCDGLIKRLSSDHHETSVVLLRSDLDIFIYITLHVVDGVGAVVCFVRVLGLQGSLEDHDKGVPASRDRVSIIRARLCEPKVDIVSWSTAENRTLNIENFACNDLGSHSSILVLICWDICGRKFLIVWLTKLILGLKIDPELESVGCLFEACRHLSVDYAFAGSHPLDISRTDLAFVSFEIFMGNYAVDHIRHSLKASMRMIRKTSRQFDVKKIKHQKGVQIAHMLVPNNPSHLGSITFPLLLGLKSNFHRLQLIHY